MNLQSNYRGWSSTIAATPQIKDLGRVGTQLWWRGRSNKQSKVAFDLASGCERSKSMSLGHMSQNFAVESAGGGSKSAHLIGGWDSQTAACLGEMERVVLSQFCWLQCTAYKLYLAAGSTKHSFGQNEQSCRAQRPKPSPVVGVQLTLTPAGS